MVLLRTKRDFHQARVSVLMWRQITDQEVKIECNLLEVEAFPSVTMTFLQIKPSINLREATYIIQRAFKISETVIRIQFRGETVFKVKLELETVAFLLKMVKMHLNKVKNLKN
jgi:hypothetical protein